MDVKWWAIAPAMMLAGLGPARASPLPSLVTYTLTADSSAVFPDGAAAISGSFSYSPQGVVDALNLGSEPVCSDTIIVTGSVPFVGDYSTADGVRCFLESKLVDMFQGSDPEFFIAFPQVVAYYDGFPIDSVEPLFAGQL